MPAGDELSKSGLMDKINPLNLAGATAKGFKNLGSGLSSLGSKLVPFGKDKDDGNDPAVP